MIGWIRGLFMNREDQKTDRSQEVMERLTRAQKEIERSKRLLRASGYYNDRLEGTRQYGRGS